MTDAIPSFVLDGAPDTVWNQLAARLGRRPTVAETKAELLRILNNPAPLGDGLITSEAVRCMLMAACMEAGSQREWGARYGISQAYLSNVLTGRLEPGPAVLAALGLVREVWYVEKR
jgi:hypothetical protein